MRFGPTPGGGEMGTPRFVSPLHRQASQPTGGGAPDRETGEIQMIERQLADLQQRRQAMARTGAQAPQMAHFDQQLRQLELRRAHLMQNAQAQQQAPQPGNMDPRMATSYSPRGGMDMMRSLGRRSR